MTRKDIGCFFQTGKTSLFFTEHWNSIRASNTGTNGAATSIHEPKQLNIYPRDKHIQQNMAQRFAYSRHKLWANTGRLDMGLISSSTHQQSFHAFRWSWCAGHGHEGPSSDADLRWFLDSTRVLLKDSHHITKAATELRYKYINYRCPYSVQRAAGSFIN